MVELAELTSTSKDEERRWLAQKLGLGGEGGLIEVERVTRRLWLEVVDCKLQSRCSIPVFIFAASGVKRSPLMEHMVEMNRFAPPVYCAVGALRGSSMTAGRGRIVKLRAALTRRNINHIPSGNNSECLFVYIVIAVLRRLFSFPAC